MQSPQGESSLLGNAPSGGAAHAESPPDQQVNGLAPGPWPGHPGQPARWEPPDRPRPRELGPPPPVPAKLPKRTVPPDGSRPTVPSRLYRRPVPPGGPRPPEPPSRPGPPEPSSQPGPLEPLPEPSSRPGPHLEPYGQPGRPPGGPEATGPVSRPAPGKPGTPEPSWGTVLVTTVRLSAQRRLGWVRRLWPAWARRPGRLPGRPERRRYQPRSRHSARCGRSAPIVVSLPWPG